MRFQTILATTATLALFSLATQSPAQFPLGSYTNSFDTGGNTSPFSGSGSVASWVYWYNTPGGNIPMTNDVAKDAGGNPSSGSLLVDSPFPAVNPGDNQNVFFGTFGNQYAYDFTVKVDLANFDTIAFDILVETNLAPDANGNFGTIGVGIINASYGYQEFARPTIPGSASNGWVHITANIDHTQNNLATVPGITLDFNAYSGPYPLFPFRFWVDNLVMHYSGAPAPPPTVGLTKTVPGLTQFADAKPSYNRQDIRTDTSGTADLQWYGKTKPVSYSWTIADFPGAAYPGFQCALAITPDPVASQIYSDPDWSATNCLWININNRADGPVIAGISYKTNQPSQNSQMFNPAIGQLIPGNNTNGLIAQKAVGTWTLTFTSDTDMTLTGPDGVTTNATLPADVAAQYNGPVGVYLYTSPTADANVGQSATLSAYHITGVGTPVNEDFTSGALSSPFLILNSQNWFYTGNYTNNPPNQQFTTTADAYWMHWTLPDEGFSAVASTKLGPGAIWNDLGPYSFTSGGKHYRKLTKASLAPDAEFFAVVKRPFTQLQVLFPGETNAPNTVSGKTGTPDAVSLGAGGIVNVTVNAVDPSWHIINVSGDMIHLTTTDLGAILPSDAALNNGSVTMMIQFANTGSWTVTATNLSNTNIPPATSSSVTVGP